MLANPNNSYLPIVPSSESLLVRNESELIIRINRNRERLLSEKLQTSCRNTGSRTRSYKKKPYVLRTSSPSRATLQLAGPSPTLNLAGPKLKKPNKPLRCNLPVPFLARTLILFIDISIKIIDKNRNSLGVNVLHIYNI